MLPLTLLAPQAWLLYEPNQPTDFNDRQTTMGKPSISDDPLYQLLRNENIKEFNEQRHLLDTGNLRSGDYRGRDLRNMDASGLDFSNSYFRNTDLRGIDFRESNLEGASLIDAKVSGAYFPEQLSAEEIRLSLDTGTRLRYQS
jgi:uncharacterized protein YjbI with pentapeptide repeats